MHEQPHLDQNNQTFPDTAAAGYDTVADMPLMPDGEQIEPIVSTPKTEEEALALRGAQEEWLERRGLLEEDTHPVVVTRREFEMLRNVGVSDGDNATTRIIDETRKDYGIPLDAQYALLDIAPDDASLPHTTKLVALQEEDFGKTVDDERIEALGIQPESIPRIVLKEREFGLFRAISEDSASSIKNTRKLYGITDSDQLAPEYALVDVESDIPNQPSTPLLILVTEPDFGTIVEVDRDSKYLKSDLDPNNPVAPESGAYHTVDISEALIESSYDLKLFASELIGNETENPLHGRFWMRAGGVTIVDSEGIERVQEDAYVWENSTPITEAVKLTIAFPSQYNSVCAVTGERQDAGNDKVGMAQIKHPRVLLTIEGKNLERLQNIYRQLYREPDFALTVEQRTRRDEIFNDYFFSFTAEAAENNKNNKIIETQNYQPPQYRYH